MNSAPDDTRKAVVTTHLPHPSSPLRWVAEPWRLACVTALLFSCCLLQGLSLDDYIQRGLVQQVPEMSGLLPRGAAMFSFATGDLKHNQLALDRGFLPWWSAPDIKLNFWRPLTELTHQLDYSLWPNTPSLMHAQSLVWLALLVAVVALLYRRIHGAGNVAYLAGLLYALDDAHNWGAAWLADRNGVLAALLGALVLHFHVRWRNDGSRTAGLFAALLVLPGLLAGEAFVASCGYLLAYAFVLDRGTLRNRVLSLLPTAIVVVGWYLYYRSSGYGTSGSGFYRDPGSSPVAYLAALPERMSLLLGSHFLLGSSEFVELFGPAVVIAVALLHAGVFLLFSWLMWDRILHDTRARFWYVGMLLSALPFCAVIPMERNLLIPGIGAFGCLAVTLVSAFERGERKAMATWLASTAIVVHLVLAPLLAPLKALALPALTAFVEMCGETAQYVPNAASLHLVMLDAPDACASYATVLPIVNGGTVPRTARTLASGLRDETVVRIAPNTLRLTVANGWFHAGIERMFNSDARPYRVGDEVKLPDLTIRVVQVDGGGRPLAIDAHFELGLESGQYQLLRTVRGWQVPVIPPPIGQSMHLPGKMVPIGRPSGGYP